MVYILLGTTTTGFRMTIKIGEIEIVIDIP